MTRIALDALWQLAELEVDSPGGEARPWSRAPSIEVGGGHLRWRYVRMAQDDKIAAFGPIRIDAMPIETAVKPPLLIDFINLAEKRDQRIAAFARRWGLLHPCAHSFPRSHPPLPGEARQGRFCDTVDADALDGFEPLAVWRLWSSMGRAVVRIASRLDLSRKEGEEATGDPDDWRMLVPDDQVGGLVRGSMEAARRRLATVVETWLRIGAVQPRVDLIAPPHLAVTGVDLFGAIALQLAMVVTSTKGLPFCAGCGCAFIAERKPFTTKNNYCPDCIRLHVPERDASAAYRKRQRVAVRGSV